MSVLGKYEMLEPLGSGSMGIVYRAHDRILDRQVALKVMRSESKAFPEMSERFMREARACAKLHHQNIVTVYDFGEEDGSSYIVMELLDGVDLKTTLKDRAPFSLAVKLEMMAQVCDGLTHAHQAGIVHRDLKPSNIFIHLGKQPKILDFGLVRLSTSVLTRTGMVLGTPNYMAPEQITGRKCDSRSDLFSAGIVSFEFLTGRHPFQAPFIPKRIATDHPDQICEVDPRLPASWQDIFSQALQKDPEQRFQTGAEFASALRNAVAAGGLDQSEHDYAGQSISDDADAKTLTIAEVSGLDATLSIKPEPK